MPSSCELILENPNQLYIFSIVICPDEGYWKNGKFRFDVTVPEEYNIMVCINLYCIYTKTCLCVVPQASAYPTGYRGHSRHILQDTEVIVGTCPAYPTGYIGHSWHRPPHILQGTEVIALYHMHSMLTLAHTALFYLFEYNLNRPL